MSASDPRGPAAGPGIPALDQSAGGSGFSEAGTARSGALRVGDRVQLTDSKGRRHTITLTRGGTFHSQRGILPHDLLIGHEDGVVVTIPGADPDRPGSTLQALRPLYDDYVLSMPRGATIVYPKDAAQIIMNGDIHPGARVIEAGVGSGALSIALLRAVGVRGQVLSIERRDDFAEIARANVEAFFGGSHPAWELQVGDFEAVVPRLTGRADRVVLDMLAPWDCVDAASGILEYGGLLVVYVATVTQLSRTAETIREHGGFSEPDAWESAVRPWHLDGLSVRPEHRMTGHTGFLLTARRMSSAPLEPARRARASGEDALDDELGDPANEGFAGTRSTWSEADMSERTVTARKTRRALREAARISPERARRADAASGTGTPDHDHPPRTRLGLPDGTAEREEER